MRMNGWKLRVAPPEFAFTVLALLAVAITVPFWHAQHMAEAGSSVTHLRVTSQVILPGVTRLGINLGEQNFYDSGQMMKNLLYRNPGFEGMATAASCTADGRSERCVDTRQGFLWPAGFWDGAGFEVLDGAAAGRRGT